MTRIELRAGPAETASRAAATERWTSRAGAVLFIAWRNLASEPRRFAVSSAAMAIASLLVLFMQGVVRWVDVSTTAYLDHTPSDIVVTQSGVDDLLFSQAAIPESALASIESVDGTARVTPILTIGGVLTGGGAPLPVFVVGYRPGGPGGPWRLETGRAPTSADEVVLDRGLATANDIAVGHVVQLLGKRLRVVGLSADTNAAGIFFAFVPLDTAQAMFGDRVISYAFVQLRQGASLSAVQRSLDGIPGLHGLPRSQIADNDRRMIAAGLAEPVEIIVAVCLVVGLLIAAIILYTATIEHARDFAVLKAVGAPLRQLLGIAAIQAVALTVCGYALGWFLAWLLAMLFQLLRPVVASYLDAALVAEMFVVILAVNLMALWQPLRFLRRVDPQEVFKA